MEPLELCHSVTQLNPNVFCKDLKAISSPEDNSSCSSSLQVPSITWTHHEKSHRLTSSVTKVQYHCHCLRHTSFQLRYMLASSTHQVVLMMYNPKNFKPSLNSLLLFSMKMIRPIVLKELAIVFFIFPPPHFFHQLSKILILRITTVCV